MLKITCSGLMNYLSNCWGDGDDPRINNVRQVILKVNLVSSIRLFQNRHFFSFFSTTVSTAVKFSARTVYQRQLLVVRTNGYIVCVSHVMQHFPRTLNQLTLIPLLRTRTGDVRRNANKLKPPIWINFSERSYITQTLLEPIFQGHHSMVYTETKIFEKSPCKQQPF